MNTYRLTYNVRFPIYQDRGVWAPGPRFVGKPKWEWFTPDEEFEAEDDKQARIKAKAFLEKQKKRNPENIYEPLRLVMVRTIGTRTIKVPIEETIDIPLD